MRYQITIIRKSSCTLNIWWGGNDYPVVTNTPTLVLRTFKTHFNSVLSTSGSKYMCMDAKYFYLNTPMSWYEYVNMQVSMIPEEFMIKYNLQTLVHYLYIHIKICKGMYGLSQAGHIAQDCLQKYLKNITTYLPPSRLYCGTKRPDSSTLHL